MIEANKLEQVELLRFLLNDCEEFLNKVLISNKAKFSHAKDNMEVTELFISDYDVDDHLDSNNFPHWTSLSFKINIKYKDISKYYTAKVKLTSFDLLETEHVGDNEMGVKPWMSPKERAIIRICFLAMSAVKLVYDVGDISGVCYWGDQIAYKSGFGKGTAQISKMLS